MSLDFSTQRIAVIGDVMLDTYIHGAVGRISPEAPVPVLNLQSERAIPGGAANVAANVSSLGALVRVVAVVGRDEAADTLRRQLSGFAGADLAGLVVDPDRPTTTKTRVVADRQQIVRLDREETRPAAGAVMAALRVAAEAAVAWADVVLLSDYGKGALCPEVIETAIQTARRLGKPVLVDPKRRDVEAYAGASVITPNRRELAEATGLPCVSDAEVEIAARRMIERTGADILLTRSERGMSYISATSDPIHLPTFAREVFDVSGAGDTTIATFATAIAAGYPTFDAMRFANQAAGIVVGKSGTAAITLDELSAAMERQAHPPSERKGRLVALDEAIRCRRAWHSQGLSVGFTNGCFDLLHPGHIALMEQAAAQCDRLIVGLNSDASVRRLKGATRPVQDEAARARVLGALSAVDLVVIFGDDTPLDTIRALLPDILVKGADYTLDQVVGAAEVIAAGGKVILADLVAGQSTTRLVNQSRVRPAESTC